MYIVLEGLDYTGKSTIIDQVKELLGDEFGEVITVKEPSDHNKECADIRKQLLTNDKLTKAEQTDLFLHSRFVTYNDLVIPNKDNCVISDRNFLSNIVYQTESTEEMMNLLNRNLDLLGDSVTLNGVILVETSHDEFIKRLRATGNEPDVTETKLLNKDFYLSQQAKYAEALKQLVIAKPEIKCLIINTEHMGLDEVAEEVIQFIRECNIVN